jgi:hypothetical protein
MKKLLLLLLLPIALVGLFSCKKNLAKLTNVWDLVGYEYYSSEARFALRIVKGPQPKSFYVYPSNESPRDAYLTFDNDKYRDGGNVCIVFSRYLVEAYNSDLLYINLDIRTGYFDYMEYKVESVMYPYVFNFEGRTKIK